MQVSPSIVVMFYSITPRMVVVKRFLGVYSFMEIEEIVLIALGTMVSVVAFFLKKENVRVERLSEKVRNLEISLAKNEARDCERWIQISKLLEDRRNDVINLYKSINKK